MKTNKGNFLKNKSNYILQKSWLIILLLLAVFQTNTIAQTSSGSKPNTIITGSMAGDLMKEISITVDRAYIDNSRKKYTSKIENDSFKFEFYLDVPQKITLKYLRNTADIYIEPGDHLHIDGEANSFYFSFKFSGNSSANNDFLRTFGQKYQLYHSSFKYFKYKKGLVWYKVHRDMDAEMRVKSPEAYRAFMDERRDEMMTSLDGYADGEQLSEGFKLFMWSEISYYWGYHLLTYGYAFGFYHDIDFQDFFGFMYEIPLHHERGLGSQFYRDFVMGAVNYYCEGPKKLPDPEEKVDLQLIKQFKYGEEKLDGKVKAFFLSEIIRQAFAKQVIKNIQETYDNFLETNPHKEFNRKVN